MPAKKQLGSVPALGEAMTETPEERAKRLLTTDCDHDHSGALLLPLCAAECKRCLIEEIRSAEAAAREEERERCIEVLYRLQDEHISIAFWGEVIGKGIDAIRALAGEEGE